MSITHLESFDDGLYLNRGASGSALFSATYGQNGDGVSVGDAVNGGSTYQVPTAAAGVEFTMGLAVKIIAPGGGTFCQWGGTNCRLFWDNGAGKFGWFINGGSSADQTWYSDNTYSLSEWHYIECNMKSHTSSGGHMKWWIDGVEQADSATSFDWSSHTSTNAYLGGTLSADIDNVYFDNIYVTDTTGDNALNLGPIEVVPLLPNGNGNSSVLVGQDADSTDNYLNADEATPDDGTTYNGSATEGDKDDYAMENLTGTPTVLGVRASVYGAKTDSGAKYMRPVCRSGTTDYVGSSVGLSETYGIVSEYTWDDDPDTATVWTYGGVNSAQFGIEVRDS